MISIGVRLALLGENGDGKPGPGDLKGKGQTGYAAAYDDDIVLHGCNLKYAPRRREASAVHEKRRRYTMEQTCDQTEPMNIPSKDAKPQRR
jgi:hypothetical protein